MVRSFSEVGINTISSRGLPPLMNYFVGIVIAERGVAGWETHGAGSLVNR